MWTSLGPTLAYESKPTPSHVAKMGRYIRESKLNGGKKGKFGRYLQCAVIKCQYDHRPWDFIIFVVDFVIYKLVCYFIPFKHIFSCWSLFLNQVVQPMLIIDYQELSSQINWNPFFAVLSSHLRFSVLVINPPLFF